MCIRYFAVCDNDCEDLDLYVYDGNNNEIARDWGQDDYPVLTILPLVTGLFKVKVVMYNCVINPCKFGLAVFGK